MVLIVPQSFIKARKTWKENPNKRDLFMSKNIRDLFMSKNIQDHLPSKIAADMTHNVQQIWLQQWVKNADCSSKVAPIWDALSHLTG